jgi:hypothetical protein
MPSSIVMHIHNGWIKSSLVNLHPSPFIMLHLKACFPCPRHWDPTLATIVLKLVWPKLVLGMVDIVLEQLLAYPTHVMLCMSAISNILIIPPLRHHGISQDVIIHFSMVSILRMSFRSWSPPRFHLFYHQTMHLLQMLGQQPFGTICNNVSANFTFPFWPNLHLFFVL